MYDEYCRPSSLQSLVVSILDQGIVLYDHVAIYEEESDQLHSVVALRS